MAGRLPTESELRARAEGGELFTPETVSDIAKKESEYHGGGPIAGGVAAVAQSIYDKQQNFLQEADKFTEKPSAAVTKEDAARLQHLEAAALGAEPGKGSLSAQAQSIANRNELEKQAETTNTKE